MDGPKCLRRCVCLFAAAACVITSTSLHSASSGSAPSLPAPTGAIVNVATETQLQNAVSAAPPGTTIVIAPGTYNLTSTLYLDVDDLTLRGATNNRNDVILVGKGMTNGNYGAVRFGVWTNASRITIANLTIRDVYEHHIILNPGAESPRIYNVRLVDAGSQFIRANPDNAGGGIDNGRIEYSVLEHSTTAPDSNTNGVDVLAGSGWVVSNNVFRNFRAPHGQLAGPTVVFRGGSRDALVEGNTFVNCQREIALGLEAASPDDNTGGMVRNNFIYRMASIAAGSAISVSDSPNTQVLHNTVLVNGTYPAPIEYRFPDTTGVVVRNNLLDGSISARDGASGTVTANYTSAAASMFVNPTTGDLHLRSTATAVTDRVTALSNASQDWDGESRPQGSAADYGADEVANATSPPNQALTASLTSPADWTASVAAATTTLVASGLPSPWLATSIGSPAVGGSATYASGTFTIKGAGANISGTADQFHFAYRTLTGNGEIVARVASLQNGHAWAKAGVMIRETLTASSRHAFAAVTPENGLAFVRRVTTGGASAITYRGTVTAPYWVRLVRSGSTFSAYQSATGTGWTLIGSQTISMAATVYVGLAVSSQNISTLATATFTGAGVTAPSAAALPSPWLAASIGSPAVGGSATYASGTFTIKGAGANIAGSADQFHFAYRTLTGDGEIVARVASLQNGNAWGKAGVMIRETLSASSRHAFAAVTPENGLAFVRRVTTGGASAITYRGTVTAPYWVRLVRSGSTFSAYQSATGTGWTLIGSQTISMAATVYVGLAVSSQNVSTLATATFTGAVVTAATANAAPSVSLTSPSSTTTFNAPATISVTASASDSDGTVASVTFYAGSTRIGSADTSSSLQRDMVERAGRNATYSPLSPWTMTAPPAPQRRSRLASVLRSRCLAGSSSRRQRITRRT